jgi:putative membrane protein
MRKLVLKVIANMVAFYCAAKLFPSISLNGIETAVWAGLILGVANLLIRPLLFLITLPINLLSLGLFSLVINTWMVMLTDTFLSGLHIPGFWLSFATAVIVWVCNMVLLALEKGNDQAA